LLVLTFGRPLVVALLLGLALTPAGLVGAWLGGQIGRRLSRARLRTAMTVILVAIALEAIVGPMLDSLGVPAGAKPSRSAPGTERRLEPDS
jgi:uncharacterized membrane protein YfcA